MRRKTRWAAALALACAAATGGRALAQSSPDSIPQPADVPARMPEINVTVVPPKVDVRVDSPALTVQPGQFDVRPEGLGELKRNLDSGQWKGAFNLIEGNLRARLTRDPVRGFQVFAQAAPDKAQPKTDQGDVLDKINPDDLRQNNNDQDQQRLLELYRAQLGEKVQLQKAAFLGVSTSGVPEPLRKHLGLPEGVGLVVDVVEKDSPAEKAGVKQYDILNKLDDQILVNAQQLAVLVRSHKPGDSVTLNITRGGKTESLSATLVEKDVQPLGTLGFFDPNQGGAIRDYGVGTPDKAWQNWAARKNPDGGFTFTGPKKPADKAPKGKTVSKSHDKTVSVYTDDDYEMTITAGSQDGKAEGRHLVAKDRKSGKVLYDGPVDEAKNRNALPGPVADRLKQMDKGGKDQKNYKEHPDLRGVQRDVDVKIQDLRELKKVKKERDSDLKRDRKDDGDDDKDEDHDADDDDKDEDRNEVNPKRAAAGDVINRDDFVEVSISDLPRPGVETVKVTRVRGGEMSLPFVGKVKAEGLTEEQLQQRIVKTYADAKLVAHGNVQVKRVQPGEDVEEKP